MNNAQLEILAEARKVAEGLGKIFNLCMDYSTTTDNETENIGSGDWFCNQYPFAVDLESLISQVYNWVNDMGEGK